MMKFFFINRGIEHLRRRRKTVAFRFETAGPISLSIFTTVILCASAVSATTVDPVTASTSVSGERATTISGDLSIEDEGRHEKPDSVYTRYDWRADCDLIDSSPPDGPGAWARLVCPGPSGTFVMLTDDDGRVSLDYATQRQFGPWESFSTFNNVHHTVEWRRHAHNGRMEPFATIHRWILNMEAGERETLVISTVARQPDTESCMVGYIDASRTPDANQIARHVADRFARGFTCGDAAARAFGQVDPETPTPQRVEP